MDKLTLVEFNAAYNEIIRTFGTCVESSMVGLELTLTLKPMCNRCEPESVVFNQTEMSVTTAHEKSRLMEVALNAIERTRLET